MSTDLSQIPGVGQPALSASRAAGFASLEALDGADHAELAALQGTGPRGLERLQAALKERGLSLSGDLPTSTEHPTVVARGHTGKNAEDLKTRATETSPAEFVASLPWPRRIEDAEALLELFGTATGASPVMWGPSMIGYGQVHYRYATGREGDSFHVGFGPRKASLSLYGLQGHPRSEQLLARLGKHRLGAGCVYVNTLEDIRRDVLQDLIRHAWDSDPKAC